MENVRVGAGVPESRQRLLSISVVPFIRKDFGERYLGWLNLFFGYTVVANFFFLGNMIGMITRRGGSQLMGMFWLAFIAMSIYRRREITAKNNAGVEWHSMISAPRCCRCRFRRRRFTNFSSPRWSIAAGPFPLERTPAKWACGWMISAVALLVNNHIVYYNERRGTVDMAGCGNRIQMPTERRALGQTRKRDRRVRRRRIQHQAHAAGRKPRGCLRKPLA